MFKEFNVLLNENIVSIIAVVIVMVFWLSANSVSGFFFSRQNTVSQLDIEKYLGRWYEAYSSFIPKFTFQKNGVCTTATYTLMDDQKTIKVFNSARKNSPDGVEFSATGTAIMEEVGGFIVQFPRAPPQSKPNYFVLKLGPATYGPGQSYEYAVIGGKWKLFCWVLVRDMETFKSKHETEVLVFLKERGYCWPWNKPRPTMQCSNCKYPPMEKDG